MLEHSWEPCTGGCSLVLPHDIALTPRVQAAPLPCAKTVPLPCHWAVPTPRVRGQSAQSPQLSTGAALAPSRSGRNKREISRLRSKSCGRGLKGVGVGGLLLCHEGLEDAPVSPSSTQSSQHNPRCRSVAVSDFRVGSGSGGGGREMPFCLGFLQTGSQVGKAPAKRGRAGALESILQ